MLKYPNEIYITREKDGNESYLIATEHANDLAVAGEKVEVAIYKLVKKTVILAPIKIA